MPPKIPCLLSLILALTNNSILKPKSNQFYSTYPTTQSVFPNQRSYNHSC